MIWTFPVNSLSNKIQMKMKFIGFTHELQTTWKFTCTSVAFLSDNRKSKMKVMNHRLTKRTHNIPVVKSWFEFTLCWLQFYYFFLQILPSFRMLRSQRLLNDRSLRERGNSCLILHGDCSGYLFYNGIQSSTLGSRLQISVSRDNGEAAVYATSVLYHRFVICFLLQWSIV